MMNFRCAELEAVYVCQKYFEQNENIMLFLSHLGDPRNAFLVLFPLTYCFEKYLGLKMIWTLAITEWLNAILKWCVLGDRPYWLDARACNSSVQIKQFYITCETGPGFPSGHVMSFTSSSILLLLHFYDRICERKNKIVFLVILVPAFFTIMILLSVSRIYIAAHFPHQVLAGALFGMVIAFFLHTTSKWWPFIIFNYMAAPVGILLVAIAYSLYCLLFFFDFNPSSTVKLALQFCKLREWVHLDTTLFSAIIRDAGCLCSIGFASAFVVFVSGNVKPYLFLRSNQPFFKVTNLISALIICPSVYYVFTTSISQIDILWFYACFFVKNFLLPLYVFVVKYALEKIFVYVFKFKKS